MKDRKIARLQLQLEQAKPRKRRKVVQELNERFMSLAQVLSQSNREPQQRTQRPQQETVSEEEGSSDSEEDAVFTRRSNRARQPTRRYIERDEAEDESVSES